MTAEITETDACQFCGAHLRAGAEYCRDCGQTTNRLVTQMVSGAASSAKGSSVERRPAVETVPGAPTNALAIAALIVVFFSSIVGLVLGHVALAQIDRTGENGRGLALAAVVLGWTSVVVGLIVALLIFGPLLAHRSSY